MSVPGPRLGAIIVVSLGLVLGAGAPGTDSNAPCRGAVSALESGRLTVAGQLFTTLPARLTCAQQGLAATSALLVAEHLMAVGLDPAADAEIVRALQADPSITLPSTVLPQTDGEPGIALAETLDADGFHAQAVQVLLRVIEQDPSIRLDAGARAILGLNGVPFWVRFRGFVLSWKLIYLLLVLLAVWVIAYPRLRRRLHLQTFTLGDSVTDTDPADLRRRIADELRWLVDESARTADGRRFRLELAGPYEDQWEIGPVVNQLPGQLQLLCAVTGMVLKRFPSRSRLVTGALAAGTAVRLSIQTVDKVTERQTVIRHKELEFPHPAPNPDPVSAQYAQLALPAAAWIILNRFRDVTLGGTREWRSFVHFTAGYAWQEQGNLDEAKGWYRRACDEDPRNSAAAVNLAALQQRDQLAAASQQPGQPAASAAPDQTAGSAAPDQAAPPRPRTADRAWDESLRRVVSAAQDRPDDLQRLRSLYLLSLGLQDASLLGNLTPQERENRRDMARRYATELAITIEEAARRPGDLPETFVRNSRGAALTLVASQIIPTTDDLAKVSTQGFVTGETSSGYVLGLLRTQGTGAPERLVAFVKGNCQIDDQVNYHLYRYYFNRAEVSEQNAVACRTAVLTATGEKRETLQARLRDLRQAKAAAQEAMTTYRAAIGEDADPVLRARVKTLDGFVEEFLRRDAATDDRSLLLRPAYDPAPQENRGPARRDGSVVPAGPDIDDPDFPGLPDTGLTMREEGAAPGNGNLRTLNAPRSRRGWISRIVGRRTPRQDDAPGDPDRLR
jgi:tetratricopeptide (TPR) repeat protein